MLPGSLTKQLCLLGESHGREVAGASGNRWGQTLLEALSALQLNSLVEQDVPTLLTDEERLLPSHLHVLLHCISGEHRQFLLINVSAAAKLTI